MRHGLADVVQQRGPAGSLGTRAELVGHHCREPRDLDRVGEDVLAVARAELQAAEQLHQLGVQPLDARLEYASLPELDDMALELGLRLQVHLLYPGRVDTPVLEQLLERELGDL